MYAAKKYGLLFLTLCLVKVVAAQWSTILPDSTRHHLFYYSLMEEVDSLCLQRKHSVEQALQSPAHMQQYQQTMRQTYLSLLGDMPERTPLQAEVVDLVEEPAFRVERLHFESRPSFHVTAHFYIPRKGDGPFPTVLFLCGHYPEAKTYRDYQLLAISLAQQGVATFIADPLAQGERYQLCDTAGQLLYVGGSGTTSCALLDPAALLVGTSVVAYELWDNIRALDYLYSRADVVDTARVACIGHSGGGAQAAYLLAYDQRIRAGAIANFLMNKKTLFESIGPQTGSQNLPFTGAAGMDHADFVALFAPKPFLLLATTNDFFAIEATRTTKEEMQQIYACLQRPQALSYQETADEHALTEVKREALQAWLATVFRLPPVGSQEPDSIPGRLLQPVSSQGQVKYSFSDELSVAKINQQMGEQLAVERTAFWQQNTTDSCLHQVRSLLRLRSENSVQVMDSGYIDQGTFTVQRILLKSGQAPPLPAFYYVPHNGAMKWPAVLCVSDKGKGDCCAADGLAEQFVDSGRAVLAIDLRGYGELADSPEANPRKYKNKEHRNSYISLYVGQTLSGQRVEDIFKALDFLSQQAESDTAPIILWAAGQAVVPAIHAAALDQRIVSLTLQDALTSWLPVLADPNGADYAGCVVPGALKYYDLSDLLASFSGQKLRVGQVKELTLQRKK